MSKSMKRAVLLVDGYNMIGLWPKLQASHYFKGLEIARRDLVEILVNYSAVEDLDTKLIFDSQHQYTPKVKEMITNNLSVHFTDYGQTADTFIEKFCATYRHQFKLSGQRLIVATSDRVQRLTVEGYGAELMSAQQLAQSVDHIARRYHRRYKSGKQTTSRFLFSSLDAEAQKRLTKMRMGHKD